MGGKCPHRSVKKRRYSHKTSRRTKFLLKGDDAVYDELQKAGGDRKLLPVDEDLPGMGQYYCLHCDRYFANTSVRDDHFKTKRHKKRNFLFQAYKARFEINILVGASHDQWMKVVAKYGCSLDESHVISSDRSLKLMAGPAPHTQLDADLAAGMGMPDNGPKLMLM